MSLESLNGLSISERIAINMKISIKDVKCYFDFSKLKNCDHLPLNVSTGAQTIFKSKDQNDFLLTVDNFYYILEAAQHFKLHTIESDCNSFFTTHMMDGNFIETLIMSEKYFNMYKSTMNLAISNVCKIFHELTEEELFKLKAKHLKLILNWNYKINCSEYQILEIVLQWMINLEKREAGNVDLRLNIMEIFNCIRFDDLTEEDFKCLTICIDERSNVYELFKLIFDSKKKDNTAKEFKEIINSYEFPTIRGVEDAIVEFEKTDLESLNVSRLSINECVINEKITIMNYTRNVDFSKLKNCDHLPFNVSAGAQILFQSKDQNSLTLTVDNFYYILEAAQHFKLHTIESDCNSFFTTYMINGNSIETLITCEKYFNTYKSTMNLAISNVCKTFHELTEEELFKLKAKHLKLILSRNYKIECSEYEILETILKWMVNLEKREAGNVDLRLDIMDIFHSIQFDEITEEDFIALIINIDEKSNVYEIFQLIFYPIKKNKTSNEFTNMMKSYGFPTNRGVEYSLVQLNKTDHLEMVCTMPLSKTSPEWEKRCNTNIGGRILEKWSIVYENNLFVFGNAETTEKTFQFGVKYCPPIDNWIKVKELENGYKLSSLNAVGNYFIGIGLFDDETKKFAMKYDPNLDVWSKIEEMPVLLHQYATIAFDEILLISGGKKSKDSESTREFWMYSLSENAWTQLPDMSYDRSNHVMLKNNSKIYFIGGAGGFHLPIEDVECFDMITQTFKFVTSVITKRFSANYILFDNKIFIRDGFQDTELTKRASHSIEVFDLKKLNWTICYNINIHYLMYDSIHMYKT